MRKLIIGLAILIALPACRHQGAREEEKMDGTDSLLTEADTLSADSLKADPPKSADGLFDDFIYVFMRNERFQRQRISFPLQVLTDGKSSKIDSKDWTFDPLYSRRDTYTLIFNSEAAASAEKDTAICNVVLDWVDLKKKRVKQYTFRKDKGQWRLVNIDQHSMADDPEANFYEFYRSFAGNLRFQQQHVNNPLHFKTYDADDFQNIEGVLDALQWPDFRPELPRDVLTNIRYGKQTQKATDKRRVLMLCSPSGGMGCSLTFDQLGKSWMLVKLVN